MQQYLDVVQDIVTNGRKKSSVQGVDALTRAGLTMRFDMSKGEFPLLTVRDLSKSWKAIVEELLWFLSGSTNVKDLEAKGVKFWGTWAYEPEDRPYEAQAGYVRKWKEAMDKGEKFPKYMVDYVKNYKEGDAGPLYGHQWRHFNSGNGEIDQITNVIENIKKHPNDRRNLVTTWNPGELDNAFLVPCHGIFHCVHADGVLDFVHFQRSADVPIGVPFNIASYALLHLMICQVTGLKPGEMVFTLSDAHIYMNQMEQIEEILKREPRSLPKLKINPKVKNIFDFTFDDFELVDYNPHPGMKFPVLL